MRDVFGELDILIEKQDADDNVLRVIARSSCMRTGIAAWKEAAKVYPNDRITMRHRSRKMRDSTDPEDRKLVGL